MIFDIKTTRELLASYGADISHWPDPEAAHLALRTHGEALAAELAEAKALDAQLAPVLSAQTPAPSELLQRRILKNMHAQNGEAQINMPANDRPHVKTRWRAIAAMFVAIGAVGFAALSLQSPDEIIPPAETQEAEVWREAALDLGVDDVFDWVYSEEG